MHLACRLFQVLVSRSVIFDLAAIEPNGRIVAGTDCKSIRPPPRGDRPTGELGNGSGDRCWCKNSVIERRNRNPFLDLEVRYAPHCGLKSDGSLK